MPWNSAVSQSKSCRSDALEPEAASCRLRSMEKAAADLGKFRNERIGIPAGQGRGVYLCGQQDSGCEVCAAGETTLLGPSWKLEELRDAATHTTVTKQILIDTF
jgi:hypothetical protein